MYLSVTSAAGLARLSNLVHGQANFMAYMNGFFITAVMLALMIPLTWLMHDVDLNGAPMAH